MTDEASTWELVKFGINIGAIILSSFGVCVYSLNRRRRDRMEGERRADENNIRVRLVYLERFERWIAWHLGSTGKIGSIPPWSGGPKPDVSDRGPNSLRTPDDWSES